MCVGYCSYKKLNWGRKERDELEGETGPFGKLRMYVDPGEDSRTKKKNGTKNLREKEK